MQSGHNATSSRDPRVTVPVRSSPQQAHVMSLEACGRTTFGSHPLLVRVLTSVAEREHPPEHTDPRLLTPAVRPGSRTEPRPSLRRSDRSRRTTDTPPASAARYASSHRHRTTPAAPMFQVVCSESIRQSGRRSSSVHAWNPPMRSVARVQSEVLQRRGGEARRVALVAHDDDPRAVAVDLRDPSLSWPGPTATRARSGRSPPHRAAHRRR